VNSIALQASGPVSPVPTVTGTMDIVRAALATGNIDMYREAVALAKELDAIAARKAFDNAMADAKAEMPLIKKNRHVSYGEGRGKTDYDHEDLAEVVDTVAPILSKHGLNHRWITHAKPGEPITVKCIISHRSGHREEGEPLSAGADTSGSKNPIQAMKSTVSYLERITLMASLGLASRKDDDDGRGTSAATEEITYTPPDGSITQEQADELRDSLEAKGINRKAFLQWAGQKRIEEIPATQFEACKEGIRKHQGGQK
jgi:hypothetical protein